MLTSSYFWFCALATSTSIDKSAPLEILSRPAQVKRPSEDTQIDPGKKVHFDEEVRQGKVSVTIFPQLCKA